MPKALSVLNFLKINRIGAFLHINPIDNSEVIILPHKNEIAEGRRFKFGANWAKFLTGLGPDQIEDATSSLTKMLRVIDLSGKSFLDAGCGSGLFSLAARRLGAKVHSFDYDPESVACTRELKNLYFPEDQDWIIEEGSVLDLKYLNGLGKFDIVYSWGVLHHTGNMALALSNISSLASQKLFIAIYNDQGWVSKYWKTVKAIYNKNSFGRGLIIVLNIPYLFCFRLMVRRLSGRSLERGMSLWYDMFDWLGGYPFEVARPEEIVDFYFKEGFTCIKLITCRGRMGCNEFVFIKN